MSARTQKFQSLANHAWYCRVYKRMPARDLTFALQWIQKNDHLDRHKFEMAVNRMFLDKPEMRAKMPNWKTIMELCSCANTEVKS